MKILKDTEGKYGRNETAESKTEASKYLLNSSMPLNITEIGYICCVIAHG